MSNPDAVMYCPVCGRHIKAANVEEVEAGEHDGFIFVHDEIPHDDHDLAALNNGMQ